VIAIARRLAVAWPALLLLACSKREPSNSEVEAEPRPEANTPVLVRVELARVDDEAREQLAARLGPNSPLAGAEALLAVHHQIEPGWHIYWQNPGDSGLRTRVEVEAEHARPGEVLYPGPDRFTANGGQVMFGWEGEAVLFVPLHELEPGAKLEVRSSYLACAESCIPGETELATVVAELPPAAGAATAAMLERVPEPATPLVMTGWVDGALRLQAKREGLELAEFFPYASDTAFLGRQRPIEGGLELHYRFSGSPPEGPQGVLRAKLDGETRWLELAVPWPPA
jgi:DsbC/DsbD-like thiol-disulfide interchange protein